MKSTGVIRRIDDLGRIVIPKEIRRNLKIRDGENMEIFIDTDAIILKKYSRLEDMNSFAAKYARKVSDLTGYEIMITDREKVIVSCGQTVEKFLNQNLSHILIKLIDDRESYKEESVSILEITPNNVLEGHYYILPLISEADSLGLVIFYNKIKFNEQIQLIAQLLTFLICEPVDIS